MRNVVLVILSFASIQAFSQFQDTLAIQDFEVVPMTPTLGFTGPVVYNQGVSSPTSAPPNSDIGIGGSRAWETTTQSGGLTLEFDNVTIPPGYDSISVQFRCAARNLIGTGGGPDNLDYVLTEVSTDGGLTYYDRLRIRGATTNNSFWPYSATGVAQLYYQPQTEVVFQPTTSGLQTTEGYSTAIITFPDTIGQVRFQITGRSSSASDTWMIDNVMVIGHSSCPAQASFNTSSTTICDGDTVDFTNTSSGSSGYQWLVDGNPVDTSTNFSYVFSGAGSYTVTLQANDTSCMTSANQAILVTTIPVAITSDTDPLCNGGTDGQSMAVATLGTPPYTYLWTSGGTTDTETGLGAGNYQVTVTDLNGCWTTAIATLSDPPAITITPGSSSATGGGSCDGWVQASASGGTGPYSYIWNDSLMQNTQLADSLCAGTYVVTVTDANGCIAIDTVMLGSLGLADALFNEASVIFYPNPTNGTVSIRSLQGPATITVLDVMGRSVLSTTQRTVDLGGQPSGVYFLRIETGKGPVTKKVVRR